MNNYILPIYEKFKRKLIIAFWCYARGLGCAFTCVQRIA